MRESFSKFLTTKPTSSYQDEKLLLEIFEFISLMLNVTNQEDDKVPWIDDIVEMATIKSGVIHHFLTRSVAECRKTFLVAKGYEKIGLFLTSLFTQVVTKEKRKKLEQFLIETFVETRPSLNLWLLKVLAVATVSSEIKPESETLSILVEQVIGGFGDRRQDLLDRSGLYLWAAINIQNLVSKQQTPSP
jgi:hypothetical protein